MNKFSIPQLIAIYALPVLFAIVVHEVAHGWVADWCGDRTARLSGRLTLNPLPHVDPVGTILLPLLCLLLGASSGHAGFIFGWAKPVPVDVRNMRHPRRDMMLVAFAGPLANLLMATGWAMVARFATGLNEWVGLPLVYMGFAGLSFNIMLGVLNLLPLPPLDGGRIAVGLLPPRLGWRLQQLEPYGFLILVLLLASGVLALILSPVIYMLYGGILSLVGLGPG